MQRLIMMALMGCAIFSTPLAAGEMKSTTVEVTDVWARASAGAARAGAAYLTVTNHGDETDRLIGAEADVANRVEIHAHLMDNGVMRMTKIDGVAIEPGSPTVLQPGGLHVMFMGLKAPFKQGETFPLTLVFENAGRIDVDVAIQSVGAKGIEGHSGRNH